VLDENLSAVEAKAVKKTSKCFEMTKWRRDEANRGRRSKGGICRVGDISYNKKKYRKKKQNQKDRSRFAESD
jgi:hypothetical protein